VTGALVCTHGEGVGRRWEGMDEGDRWMKRVKDPDGENVEDLANIDLR